MSTSRWNGLVCLLRGLGLINFAALAAVVAPGDWLAGIHAWLGLGSYPATPIIGYLARTTSLWFASFGVLLWFVARDTDRYSSLIVFIGWAMLIQGIATFVIDWTAMMPIWWTAVEGPTCVLLGVAILVLQRNAGPT